MKYKFSDFTFHNGWLGGEAAVSAPFDQFSHIFMVYSFRNSKESFSSTQSWPVMKIDISFSSFNIFKLNPRNVDPMEAFAVLQMVQGLIDEKSLKVKNVEDKSKNQDYALELKLCRM